MFYIFVKACRKYGFTYNLNSINGLVLSMRPNDAISSIELKQEIYEKNYSKLFLEAIKRMKAYREGSERL